jgi:hypothetical protein
MAFPLTAPPAVPADVAVLLDSRRCRHVGAHGGDACAMPHLDRFARRATADDRDVLPVVRRADPDEEADRVEDRACRPVRDDFLVALAAHGAGGLERIEAVVGPVSCPGPVP